MGRSLLDRIQAKLEFFRLEQHYTRRRHRRSTFISNAIYVDGEYVYQTPSNTGASTDSGFTRVDALHAEHVGVAKSNSSMAMGMGEAPSFMGGEQQTAVPQQQHQPQRKRLTRFGSMPSFSGSTNTTQSGSSGGSGRQDGVVYWIDQKR